jgi:hypothetical protein
MGEMTPAAKARWEEMQRADAVIVADRVKSGCSMMFSWRDWAARLSPLPSESGDILDWAGPSYATYSGCLEANDARVARARARRPYMTAAKLAAFGIGGFLLWREGRARGWF